MLLEYLISIIRDHAEENEGKVLRIFFDGSRRVVKGTLIPEGEVEMPQTATRNVFVKY